MVMIEAISPAYPDFQLYVSWINKLHYDKTDGATNLYMHDVKRPNSYLNNWENKECWFGTGASVVLSSQLSSSMIEV